MPSTVTSKVLCRTPSPQKQPTRIDAAKLALVREAILAVLKRHEEGVLFQYLPDLVNGELSPAQRRALGSIRWYTTTVKLELEVRGEIRRAPGLSPQVLFRVQT